MNYFYITTPIYYVNAKPHLGHAYTTILCDCINRFHRLLGQETFFLTGTDEHGDKIADAAAQNNEPPQEYADRISGLFKDLWPELDIENNAFIRTTSQAHKSCVQKFLQLVYQNGDIYFGEYGGYYCFGCERFYTEKELIDGVCPDHLKKPAYIKEKNYFFRMSNYQEWLKDYIQNNPEFIQPEQYRKEVLAMLREPLDDLCISRPKQRLQWGIELPFDREYVTYVWFDALLNYISALDWPHGELYQKFWPNAHHVVAKDILKPHAIFWPTMLISAGVPLYKGLRVHGYWKVEDTKMSKSLGNVIEPLAMRKLYGLNAFRYFLMREMHFGHDGSFSEQALVNRFNTDLANDLGNLFNRSLVMTHKYFRGVVPRSGEITDQEDKEIIQLGLDCLSEYTDFFSGFQVANALESLWKFIRGLNKYIDTRAPWSLYKNQETEKLANVLAIVLTGLYKTALALWPVMPQASEQMLNQLGMELQPEEFAFDQEKSSWRMLQSGLKLAEKSNIFPRLEEKLSQEKTGKKEPDQKPLRENNSRETPEIDYSDFQKLDLCIGQIIEADYHPNADKLLCLKISLGDGNSTRQIVAGIATDFSPQDLIDRQVLILSNLKPRKIRGQLSQGMLLAVHDAKEIKLLQPSSPVQTGSKVS